VNVYDVLRVGNAGCRKELKHIADLFKGQCHEIFDIRFQESVSSKLLSILLGPFSIFFENSRRYSQLKVHHRGVVDTGGNGKKISN
jgi:hypothetical protein